jgi:hypothetical protein
VDPRTFGKHKRKYKNVEAKELGGALLLAKVRIGELLKDIPKAKENQHTKKVQSDNAVTFDFVSFGMLFFDLSFW